MESEPYTNELGTTTWTNRAGERHREDGPAVEHYDGSEEWYQRGVLHRVGGPAVYAAEGLTAWYQNGQLHRENGPARQWAFEGDEYWVRGQQLTADQWRAQFVQQNDDGRDRTPYLGEGYDGARRSAQIDREEADGLDIEDPRHSELLDSAQRWEAQAERHAAYDTPERRTLDEARIRRAGVPEDAIRARMTADLRNARPAADAARSPWKVTTRPVTAGRRNAGEPRERGRGLERD